MVMVFACLKAKWPCVCSILSPYLSRESARSFPYTPQWADSHWIVSSILGVCLDCLCSYCLPVCPWEWPFFHCTSTGIPDEKSVASIGHSFFGRPIHKIMCPLSVVECVQHFQHEVLSSDIDWYLFVMVPITPVKNWSPVQCFSRSRKGWFHLFIPLSCFTIWLTLLLFRRFLVGCFSCLCAASAGNLCSFILLISTFSFFARSGVLYSSLFHVAATPPLTFLIPVVESRCFVVGLSSGCPSLLKCYVLANSKN